MFVTTIIANYNYGDYINDAIDSCVNQTYKKHQICIIDNGSTDKSIETIKGRMSDIKKIDANVEILSGKIEHVPAIFVDLAKPVGPSMARNIGIDLTINNTDAFMVLDADDIMMPTKIEKMVGVMEKFGEAVGVVYADYDNWNIHTDIVSREHKEPYSQSRLYQECIVHSGSLIRKNALLKVRDQYGYYDKEMRVCEDYDLWTRLSEYTMIYHIPEVLSKVRVTNFNSTNTVDNQIWQINWQRIREKYAQRHSHRV